jgi:hypothetical protein
MAKTTGLLCPGSQHYTGLSTARRDYPMSTHDNTIDSLPQKHYNVLENTDD